MRLLAFLVLLAAAVPLRAQDSTRALPGIVVEAARGAAQAASTGRAVVLDSAALRQTGAATLADLLARRGGVFVRSYGPGGLASPSLRGAGAAQTLVLLDGFRLADPQLGQVDLSLLPTALLERVEVLHGAASAWHGSDALGGVIALSSRHAEARHGTAEAEAGAFGTRGLSLSAGDARSGQRWMAAITHRQSEGDFPFTTATGRAVRRNADFEGSGAIVTAGVGRLEGGLWLVDAHRGLPGVAGTTTHGERQHDRSARLWLRHRQPLGAGTLTAGVAAQAGTLRYTNPLLGLDETGRTAVVLSEAKWKGAISANWLLGTGVGHGFAQARHPGLRGRAGEHRGHAFGYAEGRVGRLSLAPSLRVDAAAGQAALSPRLGLGYVLTPALRLVASAGHAFRTPTFNDRFWQPGGNPDLRAERGWTVDAGLRWQHGPHSAEVTGYASAVSDQIAWLPGETGVWSPHNVGRVETRGVEVSAETALARVPGQPYAGLFYTFTDARDRSEPGAPAYNQPLRYVPREQARLYAGLKVGWLAFDAGLRYTGRRFVRTDGQAPLAPFGVAELGIRLDVPAPGGRLSAAATLDNALDAHYSVLQGYPMPPRHLRFRLGYRWAR